MTFPELAASWDRLTAEEQAFIQRCVASANGLYETVKILARLAERLQQQIVALESQAAGRPTAAADVPKECA
jgi:hypothetical protein